MVDFANCNICVYIMFHLTSASVEHNVTTPLLEECEDDIHIPKMGT
jgi:hypothetical protein